MLLFLIRFAFLMTLNCTFSFFKLDFWSPFWLFFSLVVCFRLRSRLPCNTSLFGRQISILNVNQPTNQPPSSSFPSSLSLRCPNVVFIFRYSIQRHAHHRHCFFASYTSIVQAPFACDSLLVTKVLLLNVKSKEKPPRRRANER